MTQLAYRVLPVCFACLAAQAGLPIRPTRQTKPTRGSFLGGVDPGLERFEDEDVALGCQSPVNDSACEIGITLADERRLDARRGTGVRPRVARAGGHSRLLGHSYTTRCRFTSSGLNSFAFPAATTAPFAIMT